MPKSTWLNKLHLPKWVLVILTVIFILRIPSFFEPYYYGDEMIYLSLGQGVRQGLTLYKDVHDNKPPLLYLTAAISENLFMFKAILCFWNLITIVFFYKLAVILFPKNFKLQKVSTFLYAIFTTIPLFEGSIVNSELFMVGFTLLGLLVLLREKLSFKNVYWAGFLFGLGVLFKIPAAFDLPIIIVYWLITGDLKKWRLLIKNILILGAGFLTPLLISLLWYMFHGALSEYIKAAFFENVGYLSSFRPGDIQKPFYVKNGPLIIRAMLTLTGVVGLYIFRKKLSKKFILLTLWILFGLFAVTLSERPYPHYFIQVLPPIVLLLGMFFAEKSVEQSLTVLPLCLAFFVPYYYHFYHYPTITYYNRFVKFATGQIDKSAYFDGFSSTTNRNYQIAEFLATSSRPTDRVFMWDPDSSTVYALSRRLPPIKYVADYHIKDFSNLTQIAAQMNSSEPKFIILTSGHPFPELEGLIKSRYLLISQIQNANIYVRRDYVKGTN